MITHPRSPFAYRISMTLLLLLAAAWPIARAQQDLVRSSTVQAHPVNLDFEQGTVGQVPSGWVSPTKTSYAAELTEENPKSGKRAVVLHSVPGATNRDPFGNLMQAIDATSLRGHRVRFRAAVRMQPGGELSRARLWLRVDRPGSKGGFFDNTGDRPITSGEWQYYEVISDVDDDALVLNIGMILLDQGKAWLDDVSLDDLGRIEVRAELPRPLTTLGLDNLIAFTRLFGYVRHFHPSDEAAAVDWNNFALEHIEQVEGAKSPAELAEVLESIFRPVAPTIRVFPAGGRPPLPTELNPPANEPALRVVSWQHKGFGQKTKPESFYKSDRVWQPAPGGTLPKDALDPRQPFSADLGGGVSCLIPLALFADAKGTLPHIAPENKSKNDLVKYSGNDRGTRLADVALAWNIMQHFYPYFDVVQTDWPKALSEALTAAANDRGDSAFLNTLRRMMAQLHDGHGRVFSPREEEYYSIPAIWGWIEGRLVITDVADAGADLKPGDIVLSVDGRPSAAALTDRETSISGATPQWRRFLALESLRSGSKDSEVRLQVQSPGSQARSVVVRRSVEVDSLTESRPPKIKELKPGIYYLDLDRIKDEDFDAALPQLEKASGIIFDLRGYPRVTPKVISHLIDRPVQSAIFLQPLITKPDHVGMEYVDAGRWTLKPEAPQLKAKLAFIVDGRAVSYAESWMGIIEAYKLAAIVGEPTAGTNGDINPFNLPGNYTVMWTGLKVLKHDGSRHHGVGIKPTVPVSRTIRGVAERRDEQLERAVEVVSGP